MSKRLRHIRVNFFIVSFKIAELLQYLLNDVWVLEVLEKRDFSDGGGWNTIVLFLEPDFLDCYVFSCLLVESFVYYTVCSLS